MAYDPTDPALRDKARIRLGDRGSPPILTDDDYDLFLGDPSLTYNEALAQIAEGIAVQLSQTADVETTGKLGDQTFTKKTSSGGSAEDYFRLANLLRGQDPTNRQLPKAGLIGDPCDPGIHCHDRRILHGRGACRPY